MRVYSRICNLYTCLSPIIQDTTSKGHGRVYEQMNGEKQLNERLRAGGANGPHRLDEKLRTMSFVLPSSLHVIPEIPEDESKDFGSHSDSDINLFF